MKEFQIDFLLDGNGNSVIIMGMDECEAEDKFTSNYMFDEVTSVEEV